MSSSRDFRPPPPPPPAETPYIDYGPALPDSHGHTRIVAMVRDPECFFAYWEGGDRIRIRDITDGSVHEHRVPSVGGWIAEARPEHEYEVDLLLEGRVVAVSNRARMPRRGAATAVDEEWAPTPGGMELLRALAGRLEVARRSRFGSYHS